MLPFPPSLYFLSSSQRTPALYQGPHTCSVSRPVERTTALPSLEETAGAVTDHLPTCANGWWKASGINCCEREIFFVRVFWKSCFSSAEPNDTSKSTHFLPKVPHHRYQQFMLKWVRWTQSEPCQACSHFTSFAVFTAHQPSFSHQVQPCLLTFPCWEYGLPSAIIIKKKNCWKGSKDLFSKIPSSLLISKKKSCRHGIKYLNWKISSTLPDYVKTPLYPNHLSSKPGKCGALLSVARKFVRTCQGNRTSSIMTGISARLPIQLGTARNDLMLWLNICLKSRSTTQSWGMRRDGWMVTHPTHSSDWKSLL